jgi:hypothetical protein
VAAVNFPRPGAGRPLHLPVGGGSVSPWVVAALLVFGAGALLPVLQNSTATTRGFDVQRLEDQQARLKSDIRLTESEIAGLTSLSRIETRARDIGLEPPLIPPIYLSIDEPGPSPARIPSEYLARPVSGQVKPEPWWRSLLGWVALGK